MSVSPEVARMVRIAAILLSVTLLFSVGFAEEDEIFESDPNAAYKAVVEVSFHSFFLFLLLV